MKKIFLFTFMIISPLVSIAQEVVKNDSLSYYRPHDYNLSEPIISSSNETSVLQPIESDFHSHATSFNKENHNIDPHAIDTSVNIPSLPSWHNGMIVGNNSYHSDGIGMGYTADASVIQHLGQFTLIGSTGLTKDFMPGMGFLNGLNVGANLSYAVSENVSFNAFGGMTRTGFMGPAPNLNNYYYGGFVSLFTNNKKWGMDIGVRRYYNASTGTWTTVPMAMPYYNLNGQKLGFDFGGLLLNAFQGLDKALNPHHYNTNNRNRGTMIIMPDMIDTTPHFGAPNIPYIK